MNKFNLQESEKNRILLMHRVIKEQSEPVTRTPAASASPIAKNFFKNRSEVPEIPAAPEIPATPEPPAAPKVPNPDVPKSIKDQLEVFITNGCAKNSKVVKMTSSNPQKQFAIKQESTKTPGKFRYFFIDKTVGMTDETGKFQILPNKWVCNIDAVAVTKATGTTGAVSNPQSKTGYEDYSFDEIQTEKP
jgi:hypothetical protein